MDIWWFAVLTMGLILALLVGVMYYAVGITVRQMIEARTMPWKENR